MCIYVVFIHVTVVCSYGLNICDKPVVIYVPVISTLVIHVPVISPVVIIMSL